MSQRRDEAPRRGPSSVTPMSVPPPEPPSWIQQARSAWSNTGAARPAFARVPEEGQESVWDYPRPPALVPDPRSVTVHSLVGQPLAATTASLRLLETASPPTFYLPPADVGAEHLVETAGASFCEWKGQAQYWALASAPDTAIGWSYPKPYAEFAALADYFSFYPARSLCSVDGQAVRAQAGGFYGGWITDEVVGPFKGEPGSGQW